MNISIFRYNLPVLCCEFYKEESHPFEELIRVTSECGEGFLGNLAEELLRVHLATTVMLPPPWPWGHHHLVDGEGGRVDVGQPPDIVPGLLPILLLHIAFCFESSTHCLLIFDTLM